MTASKPQSRPLGTVWWDDDPARKRLVTRICARCQAYTAIRSLDEVWIVSPAGLGHAESEYNEGHTACGLDATGLDWWWRT